VSTIKSSAENLTLNADGSGNDIKFQSNASEVAEITDGGVISSTGGSTHADNVKAKFGTGNDLEIFHDASHSRIKDVGTGSLYISGSDQVNIQDAAGEPMINCVADGTVQLAHHGDYKLATSATGVTITGGVAIGGTDAAHTLDDYEEGTWTPGFAGHLGGTGTLTSYGAWYTKVGRLVHIYCYIVCTGLGDMSGDVRISGLPFTVLSAYSPVVVGSAEGLAITAGTSLTGHTRVSDTYIKLQHWDLTTGLSYLDKDEFTADGGGVFTATYMA
jgi:hypothetical protein